MRGLQVKNSFAVLFLDNGKNVYYNAVVFFGVFIYAKKGEKYEDYHNQP